MYLDEISTCCRLLARQVEESLHDGWFPLVLGGDHSIAVGSATGTASHCRNRGEGIGLIWIDAHGDMNTPETSPSGNVHGMPLSTLLGLGPGALCELAGFSPKVKARNNVVVGVRSLDPAEAETVRRSGIRLITMSEVDRRGMPAVMEEALKLATEGTAGFHCSLDLDVVDPQVAPGVGTPEAGGITYRESHLALEMVSDSGQCLSLDCVELNPVLDSENRTGRLAVDLLCSALGKKIY